MVVAIAWIGIAVLAVVCVIQFIMLGKYKTRIDKLAIEEHNIAHRETEYQFPLAEEVEGHDSLSAVAAWKREMERLGMSPTATDVEDQLDMWARFDGRG
jgi:hypothetical protein